MPSPPPEFDLDAWQLSLVRLIGLDLTRIYLTHFGCVQDVSVHLEALVSHMNEAAEFVRSCMVDGLGRGEIINDFASWIRDRALDIGMPAEQFVQLETANPVDISVDGIMRFWQKKMGA